MLTRKNSNKVLFESPSILSGEELEIRKSDFDFEKKLGDGAFGHVWKVRHRITKEVYALKQVPKEKVLKMQAQFRREVYIMYNLSHPHIAKLYNHFEDEKSFYLIMEYCEGGNLFQRLHRLNQFMEIEAGQFFREVLLAVEYLHSHVPAIIHRDIKPENILLDRENRVKLTDFGWSNYYSSEVEPRTTVCGTPEYLPPEMVEQRTHDTSADIWCLGVLLFEMLSGRTPFKSQGKHAMLLNISKCKPKFPLSFPAQAKDLISKILVKNARERLSVKEILDHQWVKTLPFLKETMLQKVCLIPLPQFHGNFYVESTPVQFKCYKVIGEVKDKDLLMETQSTHTTNELAAMGLDPLSSRRKNNKGDSSPSNFTFSDSELVFSDSDLSKDLLEDLAYRESLKLLQDNIEDKQAGIKYSKVNIGEKEGELKDANETIKDLQGKIQQKTLEVSKISMREEALKNQLGDVDVELNNLFVFADADAEVKKFHELKQKFLTVSRATETLKKKIGSLRLKNEQNQKVYVEKEIELSELRNLLEGLKGQSRNHDGKIQVKLLEINKEVLLSQLNSNVRLTQDILDQIQKQLESNINQLVDEANQPLQEQIFVMIAESKKKTAKIEQKFELAKQKFYEKKNVMLQDFRSSKDRIFSLAKFDENCKITEIVERSKREKDDVREELQSQRLNELKYPVVQKDLEKTYLAYQEAKTAKNRVHNALKKLRSAHFDQKEKRRKNLKQLGLKAKELEELQRGVLE